MLKLFHFPTSPYVRKVMMLVIEKKLDDRIELIPTATETSEELPQANPLGKIPTLLLDDGQALYDSPVICEYLDTLDSAGRRLIPEHGPARWAALRQQALADGICDAALLRRAERRRPEMARSPEMDAHHRAKIERALDALQAEAGTFPHGSSSTIGTIAVLAALGYLDFRFSAENWRIGRPALSAWFQQASDAESFRATVPPEGVRA